MYGKVAVAAAGLVAAANARPWTTVPLSDIVHSTVADTATATGTTTAETAMTTSLHTGVGPVIPNPVGYTSAGSTYTSTRTWTSAGSTYTTTGTYTSYPGSAYTGHGGTGTASGSGSWSTGSSGQAGVGGVFSFPLANGFPDPSPDTIITIENQAHGQLSNAGAPMGLKDDTLNSLAFVAFNELFEVAYFAELVNNVTKAGTGFTDADLLGQDRATVLANLKVILAQEELHALNANGALKANGREPIAPCNYKFPVTSFNESIGLASTFTDVVLGTLPDIQTVAATVGDLGLVRAVGSVIGQEGEQNGFYRSILGKVPSELPFLTGGARNFAYNAILQNFIATCPVATLNTLEHPAAGIPLNETGTLTVLSTDLGLEDTVAKFSIKTVNPTQTQEFFAKQAKPSLNYITYINQQNKPLSVPIDANSIQFGAEGITFTASFPGKQAFLNGLTIAAVTATNTFTSVDDVASAASFGPGLIEVN